MKAELSEKYVTVSNQASQNANLGQENARLYQENARLYQENAKLYQENANIKSGQASQGNPTSMQLAKLSTRFMSNVQ